MIGRKYSVQGTLNIIGPEGSVQGMLNIIVQGY